MKMKITLDLSETQMKEAIQRYLLQTSLIPVGMTVAHIFIGRCAGEAIATVDVREQSAKP